MDTELLKLFIEVTQLGSFQKVADKNYISQRAVSKRISSLEENLHAQLFLRESNKITLTVAGAHFLKRANQLLNIMNTTSYELQNLDKTASQQLNAGYFSPFDGAILKDALFNLPPEISVSVKEAGIEHLVSDVLLGELDCAIILDTASYHYDYQQLGLTNLPVLSNTTFIGISAADPLATHATLPENALREKPILYYSSEESDYLKQAFQANLGPFANELTIIHQPSYEQMQMQVGLNQAFSYYPGGLTGRLQNPTDRITYLPLNSKNNQGFTFEIIFKPDNHKDSLKRLIDLF